MSLQDISIPERTIARSPPLLSFSVWSSIPTEPPLASFLGTFVLKKKTKNKKQKTSSVLATHTSQLA